jgi:2-haloacid dehalogenase
MDQPKFISASTGHEVNAVLFDTFGTVVDWRTGIADQINGFAQERGLDLHGPDMADKWRGGYYPSIAKIHSGERDYVPLDQLHLENLVSALEDSGVPATRFSPEDLQDLNTAWERLPAWPDSREGLRQLKRRYIIGPLSNGNTALLVNMAKNAGLPWDLVLGLDLLLTYKPNPAAYTGVASVLRLAPGEIMLAAAHNYDLQAAREAGLATAFILRPTEHGPNQTSDREAASDWDVIAQDITQLSRELGTGDS